MPWIYPPHFFFFEKKGGAVKRRVKKERKKRMKRWNAVGSERSKVGGACRNISPEKELLPGREMCCIYIYFFSPLFWKKKKLRGEEEEYNRTFLEMSFIMECFLNYLNRKKQWKFFFGILSLPHVNCETTQKTCLLITYKMLYQNQTYWLWKYLIEMKKREDKPVFFCYIWIANISHSWPLSVE